MSPAAEHLKLLSEFITKELDKVKTLKRPNAEAKAIALKWEQSLTEVLSLCRKIQRVQN